MSRINEALALKTEQEKIDWFLLLSFEEQQDIVKDIQRMSEVSEVIQPIVDTILKWIETMSQFLDLYGS